MEEEVQVLVTGVCIKATDREQSRGHDMKVNSLVKTIHILLNPLNDKSSWVGL